VTRRLRSERGTAIIETALTLPLLLLVSVGIFEFGRAYQTWEVLTNAAREGARVAVLPNIAAGAPQARTRAYMQSGALANSSTATVTVTTVPIDIGGGATATASKVTVNYPFAFMVLQPVAQLITKGSLTGSPFTMTASAAMRNETQF
jgi:Flp pilus assembly protein TadG